MKKCAQCGDEKPIVDFTMGKNGRPYSYCRPCALIRTNHYRAENRERIRAGSRNRMSVQRDLYLARLNALKSERPCYDCGGQFLPAAMEFDHLGNKSFELAKGHQESWDDVRREIDKCQLVCANCHRVRTSNRQKVA